MSHIQKYAAKYDTKPEELMRWLVEAMVIGAVSDGKFDSQEGDQIVHYVAKHAEFSGINPVDLDKYIKLAFRGLEADGYTVRIHALKGALPHYDHRLLAFRAAVTIAYTDGRIVEEELAFLRKMQSVFGLEEEEVKKAFELAQEQHTMWYVLDANPVHAYLDVLLMAAAADKKLSDEELATLLAFVIDRPEFDNISEKEIHNYIQVSLRAYIHGGTTARLVTLLDDLPAAEHRETAYGLAIAMVSADNVAGEQEEAFLRDLSKALELNEARVELTLRDKAQREKAKKDYQDEIPLDEL